MIPAEILTAVAAVMRQAESEGWQFVGTQGLSDEDIIEGIAARILALKARGWGK